MSASTSVIRSKSNQRLKELRRLFTRKGRKKASQTVLLGSKIMADAQSDGLTFDAVFFREGYQGPLTNSAPAFAVERALFDSLIPLEAAPEVLAIVAIPAGSFDQLADPTLSSGAFAMACGLQDPGNLGTIMRTAWFLGLRGLAMTKGTTDPFSPKVLRASIGAFLRSPPVSLGSFEEALGATLNQSYTPVILVASGGQTLSSVSLPARSAFFLGEEGRGFTKAQEQCMNKYSRDIVEVTIEGSGQAESLNVAVAFSLVAYTWSQQYLMPLQRGL
jgi:RNA methyltransferase, TrmH family